MLAASSTLITATYDLIVLKTDTNTHLLLCTYPLYAAVFKLPVNHTQLKGLHKGTIATGSYPSEGPT